jgi:ketosteroid isomerase-like protein
MPDIFFDGATNFRPLIRRVAMEPHAKAAHDTASHRIGLPIDDAIASNQATAVGPLARRSFLQLGVGGLAAAGVLSRATSVDAADDRAHTAEVRRTELAVRRLFDVIQTRDTAAIWSLFADDGVIEFPFLGLRITDLATLDVAVGPLLAVLGDLTYFDFVFEGLADPHGVIVTHKGHAVISFNGKSYDQTYINEVRVRNGKITLYVEYFDTAVLNEALAP